jgi:hypothetical protein
MTIKEQEQNKTTWVECQCEACTETETRRETWRERKLRLAEATFGKIGSSRHDGPDRIF